MDIKTGRKHQILTYGAIVLGAVLLALLLVVPSYPREYGLALRNTDIAISSTDLVPLKFRGTDLIPLLLTDLQQFVIFKTIGAAGASTMLAVMAYEVGFAKSSSALAPYIGLPGNGLLSLVLSVVALGLMALAGFNIWQWKYL